MNGLLVPTSFPSHLKAWLTWSVPFTRATARQCHPLSVTVLQTAQHLHPAQQHSSNNVGCHSLAIHRVAECCQIQQRDTSQASSLDWSSTLVYVVKLKEINIHYPHKWPWKNVISVIYHQRHKQHNVLAEQQKLDMCWLLHDLEGRRKSNPSCAAPTYTALPWSLLCWWIINRPDTWTWLQGCTCESGIDSQAWGPDSWPASKADLIGEITTNDFKVYP